MLSTGTRNVKEICFDAPAWTLVWAMESEALDKSFQTLSMPNENLLSQGSCKWLLQETTYMKRVAHKETHTFGERLSSEIFDITMLCLFNLRPTYQVMQTTCSGILLPVSVHRCLENLISQPTMTIIAIHYSFDMIIVCIIPYLH